MRAAVLFATVVFTTAALAVGDSSRDARADEVAADAGAPAPHARRRGVAVVSTPAVPRETAQALARAVYASRVRPPSVDEDAARVLVGDPPANDVPKVRELAELRAGLARDDAASRRLLAGIAESLDLEALLVLGLDASPDAGTESPRARLFLVETGALDAARYEPDAPGTAAWKTTVQSVELRFAPKAPTVVTPPPAMSPLAAAPEAPVPHGERSSKPFYASPWFWGTIGAAALLGGAFLFASRDTSDDPIHVRMQVPH